MARFYIFLIFMSDLKKVIKVNFRGVVQLKYKKVKKNFSDFTRCKGKMKYWPNEDRGPPIENH